MGLQTLICSPFDIPNSLKIESLVLGICVLLIQKHFYEKKEKKKKLIFQISSCMYSH